jgi:hypothetical protein
MRNYYTVFNFGDKTIGFAPAAQFRDVSADMEYAWQASIAALVFAGAVIYLVRRVYLQRTPENSFGHPDLQTPFLRHVDAEPECHRHNDEVRTGLEVVQTPTLLRWAVVQERTRKMSSGTASTHTSF